MVMMSFQCAMCLQFLMFSCVFISCIQACSFGNIFNGPGLLCQEEFELGQLTEGDFCYREPDCFGLNCKGPSFGDNHVVIVYLPCYELVFTEVLNKYEEDVIDPFFHKVESFQLEIPNVNHINVSIFDTGVSHARIQLLVEQQMTNFGPYLLGEEGCLPNKINCYKSWIYFGISFICAIIVLIVLWFVLVNLKDSKAKKEKEELLDVLNEPLLDSTNVYGNFDTHSDDENNNNNNKF